MPKPCESRDGPPVVFLGYEIYEDLFSVCFWFGDEYDPCAHFWGRMMNLTGKALSEGPPSWRTTSSSTGSEETFAKITKWLLSCTSEHMQCIYHLEQHSNGGYPTRLLHITSSNSRRGQDLNLRIVHGAQLSAGSQYATLSHRWGQTNIVRLTVDNLSSWTERIPTEILPQTFLDAAQVAKRLGIDYIWIDCLCIIQEGDELEDWKREAPTMQNVYSNACFNICASWGHEIGGLFATRDPGMVEHAPFDMRSRNGLEKTFLLVSIEKGDGTWEDMVEQSPLASRGWVFQERLLTPRNIFFCKEIVLFECYEQCWRESMGLDVIPWSPFLSREFARRDFTSPNFKTLLPTRRLTSGQDIYGTWYDLVNKYSGTELTFAKDRLAAVAGIARRFSALLENDVYVAGLWLSRLSLDMLWKNVEPMPDHEVHCASPRPTQLTFSWISGYQVEIRENDLGGEEPDEKFILPHITCVKWRTRADAEAEEYLSREDIIMLPDTPSIEIMVRGVLKRMLLRRGPSIFHVFPVGSVAVSDPEQDLKALEAAVDTLSIGESMLVGTWLDFAASDTDISVLNHSERLFYVPWYDREKRYDYSLFNTYCLLLELVCGEMGRFRRIGLLKFGAKYRELYLASQVGERDYPCWKYDDSTSEHTFFIV